MKNLPVLEGKHTRLDKFIHEFVTIYHKWMQDEYVLYMTGTKRGLTIDDVSRFCQNLEDAEDIAHFLVFVKETYTPIGDADLRDIKFGKSAESAIMIAEPEFRSKGYGIEAYELLLNYGFNVLNLKRIVAPVFYFNEPSIKLHKRVGFYERERIGDDIIFELFKK
jgi:RimJ/RimL family protein N-acetyltransferase